MWMIKTEGRKVVCHKGLFEFNAMPYALMNASSFFSELMTHILEGITANFAVSYLDDTANSYLLPRTTFAI